MDNVIHLCKMVAMNNFAYVVSLAGSHVHHGHSVKCIIKSMDDLDKVRDVIKHHHGIEFEELSSRFYNGYWQFDNITDNRDISLIVERVGIVG